MIYQYRIRSRNPKAKVSTAVRRDTKLAENLTGFVNGQKASDLEERFSIGLLMADLMFEFQPSFMAYRNMPGEIRPDFIVYPLGYLQPVNIDGDWIHMTSSQQQEDELKDQMLDDYLKGFGAHPTIRLREGDEGVDLSTIESAYKIVLEIFG